MGACTACRAAKVKCDQVFPCQRCQRLGQECLPHESRQGRRRPAAATERRRLVSSKRQCTESSVVNEDAQQECDHRGVLDPKHQSEDAVVACRMMNDPTVTQNHFGLHFLVRQWVALSLKRRSVRLLARAMKLASDCGMHLDDILCEVDGRQRGMDFLYPFLLVPEEQQTVVGSPLAAEEVPTSLWKSLGIVTKEDNAESSCSCVEDALRNRWVFVREVNKGISRFYTSPAFERNVVSRLVIEETYKANEKDISELYLVGKSAQDNVKGFSHQISLHSKPGMVTKPSVFYNVDIFAARDAGSGKEVITVDQLWCLSISSLDHSFGATEFIVKPSSSSSSPPPPPPQQDNGSDGEDSAFLTEKEDNLDLDYENLFMDVEKLTEGDDDFRIIYDLLKDS